MEEHLTDHLSRQVPKTNWPENIDDSCSQSRFRDSRKRRFLLPLLRRIHANGGRVRVLDIGGAASYWGSISADLEALNCSVVLLNLYERVAGIKASKGTRVSFECGDARSIDHADCSFDLVHSNSVIEHVGNWRDMRAMACEVRRLAPSYFVQTPNFWFPYEPHYGQPLFHWLPEQVRARWMLLAECKPWPKAPSLLVAHEWVERAKMLSAGQVHALFPDAKIEREHFFGMTKSLIAVRSAFE